MLSLSCSLKCIYFNPSGYPHHHHHHHFYSVNICLHSPTYLLFSVIFIPFHISILSSDIFFNFYSLNISFSIFPTLSHPSMTKISYLLDDFVILNVTPVLFSEVSCVLQLSLGDTRVPVTLRFAAPLPSHRWSHNQAVSSKPQQNLSLRPVSKES